MGNPVPTPPPPPASAVHPYEVKLDIFEGPLDLLLFLVDEARIEIFNLELATLTRQYLEYIKLLKSYDISVAGEFLVMAATLLRMKSEKLLPAHPEMEELGLEDFPEGDPNLPDTFEGLQRRLRDLKHFQEMALDLKRLEERGLRFFPGCPPGEVVVSEVIDVHLSIPRLFRIYHRLLESLTLPGNTTIKLRPLSIEEKGKFILRELFASGGERDIVALMQKTIDPRMEIVITFLALLELAKNRKVGLTQERPDGPITVRLQGLEGGGVAPREANHG